MDPNNLKTETTTRQMRPRPVPAPAARKEPFPRPLLRRLRESGLFGLAAVAFGLYALFLIVPIFMSARSSLTDENPLRPHSKFVGLANYREMVHDDQLAAGLVFTFTLAVGVTLAANVTGVGLAMLLNRSSLPYRMLRTIAFLPQVLSGVIVAFIWRAILTQDGLLNTLLTSVGIIDRPVAWLGSPHNAMLSIGIVVTWVLSGFTTVVHLAALQGIPLELYDAAAIDGAGPWQRFRRVTVPMMAPGTTISVTISLITVLKLYDIIAVLTGGGPADSTRSTALYIVSVAFTDNRFGYASAVAILLLIISAVVAIGVTTLLRRREVSA
ncbi:sugar ABC transporter permease [Actinoallomurus purpureus]|uniref:carbohydrate ABC transporter permease n=1 Tax=Actinoallomurus purpureus TaxID=478114 RepID=UPI00209232C5|nr:sugar ABC transporter permease [Actinoallomurus purpureus]MCO6010526.1 sugar ABC transporter permease [Actinoallomurus purpureus]